MGLFRRSRQPILKSAREIEKMARAGRIVIGTLELLCSMMKPGISTLELDKAAEEYIRSHGGTPTFFQYQVGSKVFPGNICVSLNEEVVHGIGCEGRLLLAGDIVSVDVGVTLDGYIGDAARTWPVGDVSEEARRLMEAASEALKRSIEQCVAGNTLADVSGAIENSAKEAGFQVVREYTGHGLGTKLHEPPEIFNYVNPSAFDRILEVGLTIAIEPMLNAGTWKTTVLKDNWTVVTRDRRLSAHFEDTVAVTRDGPLVLTADG
ncbi:MAG: type I methionyl aminopeptidase [Planctomycetota bacterium]|nr:MAG: type I methionyl aminopeptidase [Planctomycetota bacterium]